ncbi:MAG: DUF1653 domain-containing protein [Maledivibacter sp.]|jgi:hypothetical protein|nr:DUF1653 domain-containing protein [Maledivibacter sp.]
MEKTKALIGKKYKHYKGGIYRIINMAIHTETNEVLVIYQGLETGKVWARPKEMFEEAVEIHGKSRNRFQELNQ